MCKRLTSTWIFILLLVGFAPVTFAQQPDMIVESITGPNTAHVKDDLASQLKISIRNASTSDAVVIDSLFYVGLVLSFDSILDAGDVPLDTIPVMLTQGLQVILAGDSQIVLANSAVIPSVPPGGYYLFAIVDSLDNHIIESDEQNNANFHEIIIESVVDPDLHEDLGDAPASNNHAHQNMEAYPGVQANFPTVYDPGAGSPSGPIHRQAKDDSWLGTSVSLENDADLLPDEDTDTNIDADVPVADRDANDDGLVNLTPLMDGEMAELKVKVHLTKDLEPRYLNVWIDWNRDGDWEDTFAIGTGISEWVVRDHALTLSAGGHELVLPAFPVFNEMPDQPLWMRITLAEAKAPQNPQTSLADGRGPADGYQFGETEDYLIKPLPQGDAGDAPDSSNHADAQIDAYPGVAGNFPTVYDPANGAPSGPMHWEAKVDSWLGMAVTMEADADKMPDEDGITNIDPAVPVADRDKADDGIVNLTPLVDAQTAKLEVRVTIKGPKQERFLNVWLDWNREVLPNTEGLESPLKLESVELTGSRQVYKIDGRLIVLPQASRLLPNYPNPFNPETWIPYQLADDATVLLRIFSTSGQLVREFDLGYQRASSYVGPDKAIHWDGRNEQGERVGSGVYLYQLVTPNFQRARRMVILK